MDHGFDIVIHCRCLGTYKSNDCLRCNIFWVYHTAQIQLIDHSGIRDTIDLGNNLGIGYFLCIQSQHDIFLVDSGQWNKRLCRCNTNLIKQFLAGTVSVYDNCLRKQHTQLLTAFFLIFNNLYRNSEFDQTFCQIISRTPPTYDDTAFCLMCLKSVFLQKFSSVAHRRNKTDDISGCQFKITTRNVYFSASLNSTDQNCSGKFLHQICDFLSCQYVSLRQFDTNHFRMTSGKRGYLQCRRHI